MQSGQPAPFWGESHMTGIGNEAQIRIITEQVADAVISRFYSLHPELAKPAAMTVEPIMPAPLKWAAGIVAALLTAATIGMAFWMVTTLSGLQETVTRIDERQKLNDPAAKQQLDELKARVTVLEGYHRGVQR